MRAAILACLGLSIATVAHAAVYEVGGQHAGRFEYEMRWTYETTGTYTQHRFVVPTAYNLNDVSNLFYPEGWIMDVVDASGQSVNWHDFPYNTGELNSGHWIQVINPNPGQLFRYTIKIAIQAFNSTFAYGLTGDVAQFTPGSVAYTSPTTHIDSASGTIQSALTQALTQQTGFTGIRGDLERIALAVSALDYQSPAPSFTGRTASQVWAAQSGDCDDFVNLTCALHRRLGVPSRVVICASMPAPNVGIGVADSCGLHAFGEYWDGRQWESYEALGSGPSASSGIENFMHACEVVLGVDEDFDNLVPAHAIPPVGYPTTLKWPVNDYNVSSAYGSFQVRSVLDIGPIGNFLFTQSVASGNLIAPSDPYDELGTGGSGTAVDPQLPVVPSRLLVRAARQPSIGVMEGIIAMPAPGAAQIELFDASGRRLGSIERSADTSGDLVVAFDQTGLRSGVYFLRASAGGARASAKILYLER